MENYSINTIAFIGSLVAGLSTGLGALPIYFKKDFTKATLDLGMGFSAGVMLVASFIALILPGIAEGKNVYGEQYALFVVLIGIFAGYLSIIFIHELLPHEHLFKNKDMHHKKKLSRMSLIVLAISLHNLPEGLTVGVGFGGSSLSSGVALATAISIQNMPEGLIVALGLLSEGASKNRAFVMALLSGLIEPIAALIGFISTQVTSYALPISLGFAGGMMLFVICQEIFPELFRQGHERKATMGVIIGIATMLSIDYYIG